MLAGSGGAYGSRWWGGRRLPLAAGCSASRIPKAASGDAALGRPAWRVRAHGGHHSVQRGRGARKGPAAPASPLSLTRVAVPCHRPGCDHVLCSRQCARKGPAVSAGLTSLTRDAVPCPRLGGDYVLCSRQGAPKGGRQCRPALLVVRALQRRRPGRVHALCSHQFARKGPAASAGLTSLARAAGPGHRPGRDHVRCSRQCAGKRAGGVSRLCTSYERCCAFVLVVLRYCAAAKAGEKGQQRQQALHLSGAAHRHAIVLVVIAYCVAVGACQGPAVSAGLTALTRDAVACPCFGGGYVLCSRLSAPKGGRQGRPALLVLRASQRRRHGQVRVLGSRPCARKGPAATAGLTSCACCSARPSSRS